VLPIRDINPRSRPAPVTRILIATNVAVFTVQVFALALGDPPPWLAFAFIPSAFFSNPVAHAITPFTAAFLHGSAAHLVGNLFFLHVFGDNVEARLGSGRFATFYLLAALAAALAHGALQPDSFTPMVGASGPISAVLAVYLVWYPSRQVQAMLLPLLPAYLLMRLVWRVPQFHLWWFPAWLFLGYWAAVQLIEATGSVTLGRLDGAGVAWWAHVGGFAFGLAYVALTPRLRR
jgi:membrane associated rhomboid family serine protease